jgi:hypothetical protein
MVPAQRTSTEDAAGDAVRPAGKPDEVEVEAR